MRKYRWPLVLFVGIPFVAEIGVALAGLVYNLSNPGYDDSYELSLWIAGAWRFTAAVLLGALYPRLPNTEQSFLRLVWSYTFVLNVISVPLYFGAALAGYGDSLQQLLGVYTLGGLLSFLPMLWFARRASRASLTHAFFLVFIVEGVTLPDFSLSVPLYFEWLWRLAGSILAVWLLANFDVRGFYFRRCAAVVVVVLEVLVYLPSLVFWSVFLVWPFFLIPTIVFLLLFPVKLALIYLVRVRRPAT